MILLIALNAGAIFLLLTIFSPAPEAERKQNSIEISVVSLIGLLVLLFVAGPLFGGILAIPFIGLWVSLSFRHIAKLPWKFALLSAGALAGFDLFFFVLAAAISHK